MPLMRSEDKVQTVQLLKFLAAKFWQVLGGGPDCERQSAIHHCKE
jgi:hypothetical protein